MKVVTSLLIATLALPLNAPLNAQNPTPASGDNVFRASGQEVLLDVVVRDKKGRLIKDLKKEDFQVSDDGATQKILTFRLRQGGEITSAEAAASAAPAAGVKKEEKFDPSRQVRLVTLAFDRLGSEGRKLSRQAALDVLKAAPEQNLYWAVFMMDQRLAILQQYTSDKDKIEAGVDKATAASFSLYTEESDRIAKELEITSTAATAGSATAASAGGPPAGEVQAAMAQMTLHMLQFADTGDRNQQGQAQLFGLAAMIREQKRLPGRKTLIYFTGGLNIPADREDFFKAMIADANRANVTVYCIDANGLGTWNQNSSGNGMLAQAAQAARNAQTAGVNSRAVSSDEAQSFDRARDATMANPQVALEELSKNTGGIFIANSNDLRGPLRKVSEEINTYYEITYTPEIDKYDGHFRKIAVTLSQPDLKVQTRSGYYALPSVQGQDLLPYEMPMLSALSAKPVPREIAFRTAVKSFVAKNGTPKQVVVFDVPLENVSLTKDETAKNFRLHTSLLGLVKDSTGAIVQKISRDVNSTGTLDNYDATRAGHFIYTQYMTLAPGRYTLESAVLDRENMKVGAKKQAVIVVPPAKELAISSLTLVRKLAPTAEGLDPEDPFVFKGGKVTPELNETVKGGKGASVGLYFVVYEQPAPSGAAAAENAPKLDIEFQQDGKLVAKSQQPLPKPDEFGRINYAERLPIEGLKAGQYEVYAKVFNNGKGVQERIMLTIEE